MTIGITPSSNQPDHLLSAARWLQATLLGSVATTIAIVGVAVVGLAILNGRIDVRRGASVIVGCFILFGAPVIAKGLLHLGAGQLSVGPAVRPPPPLPTPAPKPTGYDPYAGAAVPQAR